MSPTDMDFNIRFNAFVQATETHHQRFNVEQKPTIEDLIDRAGKIEKYLREGVSE